MNGRKHTRTPRGEPLDSTRVVRVNQGMLIPSGTYPIAVVRPVLLDMNAKHLSGRMSLPGTAEEEDIPVHVSLCVIPRRPANIMAPTAAAAAGSYGDEDIADSARWFIAWPCALRHCFTILHRGTGSAGVRIPGEALARMKRLGLGELTLDQREKLKKIVGETSGTLLCGNGRGKGIRKAGALSHTTWVQLVLLDAADTGVIPREVVDKAIGWMCY